MKSHIPQIQMNLRDVFVLFGCFDFSPKDITLSRHGGFLHQNVSFFLYRLHPHQKEGNRLLPVPNFH